MVLAFCLLGKCLCDRARRCLWYTLQCSAHGATVLSHMAVTTQTTLPSLPSHLRRWW